MKARPDWQRREIPRTTGSAVETARVSLYLPFGLVLS